MTLTVEELDPKALGNARIVWTTGTGLSAEPSRSATLAAMDLATALVVHDLDHRPSLWDSAEEAGELARAAVRRASVVIGNLEECAVAVGEGAPEEMAARMIGLGAEVVLVKQGPKGVSAFGQDLDLEVPAVSVEVVNGLGAGDAFGGAVCHGLLEGWPWQETVAFANAAGAHVAARLACADAMPTEDEVRKLMAAHG